MGKGKTRPKQDKIETPKTDTPVKNPNNLQYQAGNGEFIIAQLLTLMCNKLDAGLNHSQTQVEILQKIEVAQNKQVTALTQQGIIIRNQETIIELLKGKNSVEDI